MRFSHNLLRDFFALSAGGLFTLAFAPFDFAYLALAALVVLFAVWRNVSVGRAFFRGYLFGLGSFGSGVSWVYISIHDFGGADPISSGALTLFFVAFWSLFPALVGYLVVFLRAYPSIIIAPLLWVLVEYGRGLLILNGFPWLLASYSQLSTPLAGYIPIVGAYGTSFLLALTASALVFYLQHKQHRRLLVAGMAFVWLLGGELRLVKWTEAIGEPFRFALIQGNISQDQKWRPENKLNTLLMYKKMTEEHWDASVIIWPETAIPAYLSQVEEFFLRPMGEAAQAHNATLIVSLPIEGDDQGEIYNGVVALGKNSGIYRKNHLLPFGEYMPLQPLSGFILKSLNIGLGDFTPGGNRQPLLQAGGYPFLASICYEDAFGDEGLYGLPEAAYLVNVTNDAWFGNSLEPHQHLQIARMRSMEIGRYMLRSTNTGATAVIGPDGKVIKQAPLFTTTALVGTVTPMGGMTPYAYIGDKPILYALGVLLICFVCYGKLIKLKRVSA